MTNVEAIETLRVNYPDACYEQLREAVDAAIEALKAQDAAGDTISRQAAIDALESGKDKSAKGDVGGFYNAIIQNDIDKLRNLPPAEPEIIRCKECKWFGDVGCAIISVDDSDKPTENDFCSFAERK